MSCVRNITWLCAPLSLIAALLLFVLAGMLRRGSWTFAVIAQKHKWDVAQKTRCCLHAAIFYLCISVLLLLLRYGSSLTRWCCRGRRGWRRAELDLSSCSEGEDKLSTEMQLFSAGAAHSEQGGKSNVAMVCHSRTDSMLLYNSSDVAPSTVLSRRMRALHHHHQLRYRTRVGSPLHATSTPTDAADVIYSPAVQTSPLYSTAGKTSSDAGPSVMAAPPRARNMVADTALGTFATSSIDSRGPVMSGPATASLLFAPSRDSDDGNDDRGDDDADFQSDVDPREMHNQHELYRSRFFATRGETTEPSLPAVMPMTQTNIAVPSFARTSRPQRHGAATHALRPYNRRAHSGVDERDEVAFANAGRSYRSRRRLAARVVMGFEDGERDTDELIARKQAYAAHYWPA